MAFLNYLYEPINKEQEQFVRHVNQNVTSLFRLVSMTEVPVEFLD